MVRTLFKVLKIFTWKMKRCKTDCCLDQTCNLHCGLYSQHKWLTDLLTDWMHSWLVDWLWTKIYTGWMICCKFHINIHPSQFLVQRTLCTLQLYLESLRKRFTTESNELSLDCWWKDNMQLKVATSTQQLKKSWQKECLNLALYETTINH